MEAKDTVMKVDAIASHFKSPLHIMLLFEERDIRVIANLCHDVAEDQAEISFKAGKEEGWKDAEAWYHIDTG